MSPVPISLSLPRTHTRGRAGLGNTPRGRRAMAPGHGMCRFGAHRDQASWCATHSVCHPRTTSAAHTLTRLLLIPSWLPDRKDIYGWLGQKILRAAKALPIGRQTSIPPRLCGTGGRTASRLYDPRRSIACIVATTQKGAQHISSHTAAAVCVPEHPGPYLPAFGHTRCF